MEYNIQYLPKEEWKGTPLPMKYTTEEYFDLEVVENTDSCSGHTYSGRI